MLYRIEHCESGMGPFQHPNWKDTTQEVIRYLNISQMYDIDHLPQVKKILRVYGERVRFGWNDRQIAERCIINKKRVRELGFIIKDYSCNPLFLNPSDQQVVFLVDD